MTERLPFHFSLSCTGEGNGNPLQCSCWRIPGTGEPGRLPSMGSHRVGHDCSDLAAAAASLSNQEVEISVMMTKQWWWRWWRGLWWPRWLQQIGGWGGWVGDPSSVQPCLWTDLYHFPHKHLRTGNSKQGMFIVSVPSHLRQKAIYFFRLFPTPGWCQVSVSIILI